MTTTRAPEDTPAQRLRALHRAGDLAERYPAVAGLLRGLDAEELGRAGNLLARLDSADVLARHPGTPAVSVAITGHGTLSPLVPALTAELARHGLLLRPRLADFDGYVFDLSTPDSALTAGAELVLCVLDADVVFDEVPLPWRPADVRRVLAAKVELLAGLAARFREHSAATLVFNTVPLPRRFTAQLVDQRGRAELGAVWREANARLLRLGESVPGVVVLDLDPLIAEGVAVTDPRLDVYTRAHLSPALLAAYAREVGHLARQLTGRTKKCLVVDLDETLWGGVLGEDGPDGIEVGETHRGEAFTAFQRVVRQLGSQGVLVAAVSKNDAETVAAVLRDHPRMVLRDNDFVQVIANWQPKHENLAELAAALNLGVDSFVFADDSAYECGLVERELPRVAVLRLDTEPALHPQKLLQDGWFDVRELTAEDTTRAVKYRDELARKDFLASFSSLEDYLRELDITVWLNRIGQADLARISQLTLRTNQFNLTTVRLSQAEVGARLADAATTTLAIRSADRFGENGVVGAVFLRRDGETIAVENVVLSCRVFSRGIEQACLAAVLTWARSTGATAVTGHYRPTAKNGVVREFFPRYGFTPVEGTDAETVFRRELTDPGEPLAVPEHIRLVENFEESR